MVREINRIGQRRDEPRTYLADLGRHTMYLKVRTLSQMEVVPKPLVINPTDVTLNIARHNAGRNQK